jgi:hypothetical protein
MKSQEPERLVATSVANAHIIGSAQNPEMAVLLINEWLDRNGSLGRATGAKLARVMVEEPPFPDDNRFPMAYIPDWH